MDHYCQIMSVNQSNITNSYQFIYSGCQPGFIALSLYQESCVKLTYSDPFFRSAAFAAGLGPDCAFLLQSDRLLPCYCACSWCLRPAKCAIAGSLCSIFAGRCLGGTGPRPSALGSLCCCLQALRLCSAGCLLRRLFLVV